MNSPRLEGVRLNAPAYVKHQRMLDWVSRMAALTEAHDVYWCDGSQAEYDRLCGKLVEAGTFKRLNPKLRPNSYLALSDPSHVASFGVTNPACTIPGSFSATTRCSRRRLCTPGTIPNAKIGTIQKGYTAK